MTKGLRTYFSNWIFCSYSVSREGLGLLRIFTALFILSFLLPPIAMYLFLGTLPNEFFSPPPGLMWIFDGYPPAGVFYILHALLILSLFSLLVGFQTTVASILTGLCFLFIKGFFYSLGKINHDLLLTIVPVVMAFSGWGAAYSIDSLILKKKEVRIEVQSWPLSLLALFLGFMMFTAGFAKFLGGWLLPDSQATLGHLFNQYFIKGRQDLLAAQIVTFDNRAVWEVVDYATVFFEMGFLLAIINPQTTRLFVCFAVLFHFSIMMSLNISFLPNFVAYAAFLDWSWIHHKLKRWFPSRWGAVISVVAAFLLLWGVITMADWYNLPDLNSDLTIEEFYIVLFALPIALYFIGYQAFQAIGHFRTRRFSTSVGDMQIGRTEDPRDSQ